MGSVIMGCTYIYIYILSKNQLFKRYVYGSSRDTYTREREPYQSRDVTRTRSNRAVTSRNQNGNEYREEHLSRVSRRDHNSRRDGGARKESAPYYREEDQRWRAKPSIPSRRSDEVCAGAGSSLPQPSPQPRNFELVVPSVEEDDQHNNSKVQRRIASTIVTPSAAALPMESNVTIRPRGTPRVLSFSPLRDQEIDDTEQMIGALNDMDNLEHHHSSMMEYEYNDPNDDDLLGEELREAEESTIQASTVVAKSTSQGHKSSRHPRSGGRHNASLGMSNKDLDVLRRGPHSHRSKTSSSDVRQGHSRH
ncbi:unnamed protein product, partial [Eruca vesicaria subsp. sativa]|nr:unnamed protein product [Eruca vesicaria subsp. sativa]